MDFKYDVCIIGGGITGTGIARDLALRGLNVVLLEKGDLSVGTTGRSHGLLHSGARYAVTDLESAKQCASENKILRKIAGSFIDPTDGLFVLFKGDDYDYVDKFVRGCKKANIPIEELSKEEALKIEPNLSEDVELAFKVNDAVVDPFLLTVANAYSAKVEGARIETYAKVVDIEDEHVFYIQNGKKHKVRAEVIVNATGVWCSEVAKLKGIDIDVRTYKGSILVYSGRAVRHVVNHLRVPSQGDIILPHKSTTLVGTTFVEEKNLEKFGISKEEVELLKKEGVRKVPIVGKMKLIRAYAGLRPIVGKEKERGFTLMHKDNFITITGGKFCTYRLMAEKTGDLVAKILGVRAKCRTAEEPIISREEEFEEEIRNIKKEEFKRYYDRYGDLALKIAPYIKYKEKTCICEGVSSGEIIFAVKELFAKNIRDIRRRTRLGMGYCQGRRCTLEAAIILYSKGLFDAKEVQKQIINGLRERWKGILPIFEESIKEAKLMEAAYSCVGNYNYLKKYIPGLVRFL